MNLTKEPLSGAPTWTHLDELRLGKWGEHFVKMAFVRAGLDVYSPEVDDRAIDALIRLPGKPSLPPRFLEVQVKTVRVSTWPSSAAIFCRRQAGAATPWKEDRLPGSQR